MNGTRFARSGRCRFFTSLGALLLMFGMVAIFHSSQQQLDETREQRMRCEQQQESLNIRLQSIVEEKYNLEKTLERERKEHLESNKVLEQKLKAQSEFNVKEKMEARLRYNKLQQNFKHLQDDNNQLEAESAKSRKQHGEETNSLEKKFQLLRSDLQKERNAQIGSVAEWREKYSLMMHEKERLELVASVAQVKQSKMQQRIEQMDRIFTEYKDHCDYKIKVEPDSQQQIYKPLNPPETARDAVSPVLPSFDKPHNLKSFSEQELVSPDLYRIPVVINYKELDALTAKETIPTKKKSNFSAEHFANTERPSSSVGEIKSVRDNAQIALPFSARNNHSLIINSVENFQIAPKPIKKLSEETETQLKQDIELNTKGASTLSAPLKPATEFPMKVTNDLKTENKSVTSSSVNATILHLTSNSSQIQRKIPDNVAPIPENFYDVPKNEPSEKSVNNEVKTVEAADIDAAIEDVHKIVKDNNRYINVVSDLEQKAKLSAAANEDSGAHEIKDRDFVNDQNFNLPAEEDNFFDNGGKNDAAVDAGKNKAGNDDDDDDMLGAGAAAVVEHVAIKNHRILDAEHLNNEVMGDQGKEFQDGIHIEDGNDEDEDEDDYSNPVARQQGAQAIRN